MFFTSFKPHSAEECATSKPHNLQFFFFSSEHFTEMVLPRLSLKLELCYTVMVYKCGFLLT